jgi:riboflavin kinase/FMN adenylyltransferase
MRVLHHASELAAGPRGACVALGMFDGVHLGHQHVIRQALIDAHTLSAVSLAVTFDPHPMAVVNPERAPALLQSVPQRLRAIAALGVDAALLLGFDRELSQLSGEEFVRRFARELGSLRSISVGQGFHFGHSRSGNVPLLRSLGTSLHFRVNALAPIAIGGDPVSSTRIRRLLRAGDLKHVAELLGRPYALAGIVQRGNQIGRQIGFPTANLEVAGLELPPPGVYAGRCRAHGLDHLAAINLGHRPTVGTPSGALQLEAHLLDFAGELYGEELEVEFIQQIRAEHKFPSLEGLKKQIARDVEAVRRIAR